MPDPLLSFTGRFRAERLFRPASVVVVGTTTASGRRVLENLQAGGFHGTILTAEDAAGIAALPQASDLAVVCLDGDAIDPVFAALGALGTRAAVVPGMTDHLAEVTQRTGVHAFGPGSFGMVVPPIGLNASLGHLKPEAGRLALISQSSALCRAVLDWAGPNGVGFSQIIGVGGNDGLGYATALDWLSRDPGTGAILLDIRRLKDARMFLSAARAAARLRPVVAMRAGGMLLDASGTADAVLEAALNRSGVLVVRRLSEFLAAAETLTRAKPLRGERLAIVTNAVGPAWLAADAALREGLPLATLSEEARAVLRLAMPLPLRERVFRPDVRAAADIVYAGTEEPIRLAEAASLLAGSGEVDGVLLVHAPTGPADAVGMDAIAAAAKAIRVPLLVAALGETSGAAHRSQLAAAGVPAFASPDHAVRGFLHLVQDRRGRAAARELPPSAVLEIAPDRGAVAAIFAAAHAAGRRDLSAAETASVLGLYGIAAGMLDDPHAVRLRLLVDEDPLFGPTLALGRSDALTIELPPLNLALARAFAARTPGCPAEAQAALADVLVRVSQLLVDFPEIAALTIDPLRAGGAGARVERAVLRLRAPGSVGPKLAIAPYPAELAAPVCCKTETFLVRPIRPEDAEAHAAFFSRLPAQDVRFRFFTAMRELSPEQIARLTQVDYDREIAFVAAREATGETVGVARLVREAADGAAEFAIVVQPDVKGQGLAAHLMHRLFGWAQAHGVSEIVGQVLADNAPMLGFVRHLGFTLHRAPDDESLVEARLSLAAA